MSTTCSMFSLMNVNTQSFSKAPQEFYSCKSPPKKRAEMSACKTKKGRNLFGSSERLHECPNFLMCAFGSTLWCFTEPDHPISWTQTLLN